MGKIPGKPVNPARKLVSVDDRVLLGRLGGQNQPCQGARRVRGYSFYSKNSVLSIKVGPASRFTPVVDDLALGDLLGGQDQPHQGAGMLQA